MTSSLSDLTSTLTSALSSLPPPEMICDEERIQALEVIYQLQAALQTPTVAIQKYCFEHYGIVGIRVAQGMGIFDAFAASNGAEMTLAELSSKTKGDEKLLKRILRLLCSHTICKASSNDTYQPLPMVMMLANGSVAGDMIKHFHTNLQISASLFTYFEKNGYKNPEDAYDAPFQLAYHTKDHYFDWLSKNPDTQSVFNSVMTEAQRHRGVDWFDIYPVSEKLAVSSDRVTLIDIGGGIGHDLKAFKKKFPELPGQLILQELPQVIEDIREPLPEGISAVKHNMFEPQPIEGAKAYYMRTVLHDWPDKQALEALIHIRKAMASDSLLLINEHVMPDGPNVPLLSATLDLHMMELFSALERTEQEWTSLLERAGFQVVKVWRSPSDFRSALFEATLA